MTGFLQAKATAKAAHLRGINTPAVLPVPCLCGPMEEPVPRRHWRPAPTTQVPRGHCGRALGETPALSRAAASPRASAPQAPTLRGAARTSPGKRSREGSPLAAPGLPSVPTRAAASRLHHTHRQDFCLKRHPGARYPGPRAVRGCAHATPWDSSGWEAGGPTCHQSPATAPRTSAP